MKDLVKTCVREKVDLCFYRGIIPTLNKNKCACMHGQKLRHPRESLGAREGSLTALEKVLTSVSLSANVTRYI